MDTKPTTKTWIMLTRYHKDIHGEQHSLTLRYESPLIAQSVVNLWTSTHGQETDFKIFLNVLTLWVNLDIVDIHELSEVELQRKADLESKDILDKQAIKPLPILEPITLRCIEIAPLPRLCD